MQRADGILRPSPITLELADDAAPVRRPRAVDGLERIRHGVYADAGTWRTLAPWDRYLARVQAVCALRPDAVVTHESAAAVLGLPLFGEPKDVHLFDLGAAKTHRVGDVVRHTSQVRPPTLVRDGIRCTTPAHTVATLARLLPPAFSLALLDAALAGEHGLTVADLLAAHGRSVDRRGVRVWEWAIARVDAAAESPGESVSRAVIEWLGFPAPQLQRTFRWEGHTDRADFWWQDYGVVGEFDGFGKYDDPDPDAVRAALRREKQREDRLRRHVASVARWTWSDLLQVQPLEHALRLAGLPRTGRPHRAMLATLRRNPRSR